MKMEIVTQLDDCYHLLAKYMWKQNVFFELNILWYNLGENMSVTLVNEMIWWNEIPFHIYRKEKVRERKRIP